MIGALIQFVFVSALVIALAYGSVRFLGRRMARSSGDLRIAESLAVAPGKSLMIVQAGRRRLLLGVSAQGIQLLTELPESDGDADMAPASRPPSRPHGPGLDFQELLDRLRALRR